MTDERIAELMGWHWPTSAHPDDMLAKVRAVVHEAKTDNSQQIETLYALYQQASSQRDVLMAQQTQLIEVWKQRIKEAKTEWQGLTERDVKTITENAPSVEWAVRMAESTLREKNGDKRTKAEWRGLTGDEMDEIYAGNDGTRSRRRILDLIEDRLKEKNT